MVQFDSIKKTSAAVAGSVITAATLLALNSGKVHGQNIEGGLAAGADTAAGTSQQGTSLFDADGVFNTVTDILLFLVGAISVIMLVVGGIRYVVSGGDQQAVTNAKNTILYAIVGIVIAFLAYAAVSFVTNQLQGNA